MKKIIFALLLTTCISGLSMAQEGERRGDGERRFDGERRGGGQNNEMMAMIKDRIKSEFKLSDENADSVVAYHFAYQRNSRMLERNAEMDDAKKKEKLEALNNEKSAKLKTILTDKQIKKLDEYFENMGNSLRSQRQGQGGPPEGGN